MGTVCEAIRQRRLLEFEYAGLHRVVAPYCHGIQLNGVESLRAVQVRGASRSRQFGSGKLWTMSKIVDARVLPESFTPDDPNYNPDDRAMREIHCRVPRLAP